MKILALDTATAACSVAVMCDGAIRAHRHVTMERGHVEALMPMVEQAMTVARLAYTDLDLLATTVGPGTFTGLRVGLAAVRGMALATRLPIVGVTTLEALARGVPRQARTGRAVVAAIDARRGEVYTQAFAADLTPLDEPRVVYPEVAVAALPEGPVVLVGDGAEIVAARLARPRYGITIAPAPRLPDAAHVAALAAERFDADATRPRRTPRPLYLRPPGARLPGPAGERRDG